VNDTGDKKIPTTCRSFPPTIFCSSGQWAYLLVMLYRFAKLVMWPTLHFYFRRIHVSGSSRVPKGVPLILIANHSASFLDAMLIAVETDRPVHFYARGDIFRKKWAARILARLNMIPIYSPDHGKDNMIRNKDSFDVGERILRRKGLLLIFPEGFSRMERVMLPLKKGTARVALQTEEREGFKAGLQVIPVGVNYSEHRFRADVLLCYGESTSVCTYAALFSSEPAKAVNRLTTELEGKFTKTVLAVRQPERSDQLGLLIRMQRNDILAGRHYRPDQYEKEMNLCAIVNGWDDDLAAARVIDGDDYELMLKRHGLMDMVIPDKRPHRWVSIPLLALGAPLAAIGWLLNIVPVRFSQWLAAKTVTREDFYTSVAAAAGGFGYFSWWVLLWAIAAFSGNNPLRMLVLVAPLLAYLMVYWWEGYLFLRAKRRWGVLKREHADIAAYISALRARLAFWHS
jgi:glycerol-3-phosphate O-acyltransferase / dihydroxyacetone phosphate acyltransferase